MKTVVCLIETEIHGMGVDKNKLQSLVTLITNQIKAIEKKHLH